MKTRALLLLALLFAFPVVACSDDGDQGSADPEVQIDVAPLELSDFGWVEYEITIVDNEGTVIFTQVVDTDTYGAPNGSILFVGPCVAGPTGSSNNMATVEILDVRDAPPSQGGETVDGLVLPPAESQPFLCTENADVRVAFTFVVARQADQGFADITVDIDDIFCSAKVSCEEDLHPHPETGVRGPTLVTGFSCTGDANATNAENFVGFSGELCCNGEAPGSASCTTLTIDQTEGSEGTSLLSALGTGLVDMTDYVGAEDILGKRYHNTSWLLDPAAVGAGCEFWGFGFINHDVDGAPATTYNGNDTPDGVGAAPAFHFRATIGADGLCETGVESCVSIDYDDTMHVPPCQAPATPDPIAFAADAGLAISGRRAGGALVWEEALLGSDFSTGAVYDEAVPANAGELRWALEFDTGALTAAEVASATLRLQNAGGVLDANTTLTAFAGDGAAAVTDVDLGADSVVIVANATAADFDVTALVKAALDGGTGFVGFNLREAPLTCDPDAATACDSVTRWEGPDAAGAPVLTIQPN